MLIRGYRRSHTVHTIHDRHKKTELLIYHNHCVVYSNKSDTFLEHTAYWHSRWWVTQILAAGLRTAAEKVRNIGACADTRVHANPPSPN